MIREADIDGDGQIRSEERREDDDVQTVMLTPLRPPSMHEIMLHSFAESSQLTIAARVFFFSKPFQEIIMPRLRYIATFFDPRSRELFIEQNRNKI